MKKIAGIDGLRTYACIGIVAMHILANGNYKCDGFVFDAFIPSLTNLVFLFMTISAFGMCCGYFNRVINGELDIVDFYQKRYKRILPFFALLCLMDFAVSPSIGSFYELIADLTLCFGFIPNVNITVIGVGWFLGVVFVFYFIFPFFCFILEDKRRAWFGLLVSLVVNYLCIEYFDVSRKSIAYCFVYFLVGGLVFLYKDDITRNKYAKRLSLLVAVIAIILYYVVGSKTIIMMLINASVLIFTLFICRKGILINWFTKKIGNISFEIYLCHMFLYRILERLGLTRLTGNDYLNYIATLVAVLLCAVVFASIMQIVINKMSLLCKGVNNGR